MQIIDSLTTDWDPKRYHDTYTEELQELIEAKAKGKEITVEPDEEQERQGDRPDGGAQGERRRASLARQGQAGRQTRREDIDGDAIEAQEVDRQEVNGQAVDGQEVGLTSSRGGDHRRVAVDGVEVGEVGQARRRRGRRRLR